MNGTTEVLSHSSKDGAVVNVEQRTIGGSGELGDAGVGPVSVVPPVEVRAVSAEVSGVVTDSQLAVLLRQAQWTLDEAAHDVPAGRAGSLRRVALAGTLETLAVVLRASVPEGAGREAGA